MSDDLGHHETGPTHQLERLVFFSDAVFAIAITFLVIELHAPNLPRGASDLDYIQALANLIPHFVSFIISFFVIGSFWAGHHRAFSCARHWDPRLLFPNLELLFTIVAMPFFTAFVSVNSYARVPAMTYCGWLMLTALLNIRLQRLATAPSVLAPGVSAETVRSLRRRGFAVLFGATTGFVVGWFEPLLGSPCLMTIPLWRWLINRLDRARGLTTA
jgi:uncharacterized membrane protein